MIDKEKLSKIKILAFDLDGTLLGGSGKLTGPVKASLSKATEMGLQVVIATGREISTIPDEVLHFPGIRYAVTSNGARTFDLRTGECIYENLLTREESIKTWVFSTESNVSSKENMSNTKMLITFTAHFVDILFHVAYFNRIPN